jgi:LacI family transcriptional regulator
MNLEELARLAGVSRSTVSRVINGDRWVSAAARAKVEEAIRLHDYHPNAAARGLASRRTRILGLLIPTQLSAIFADPFFAALIQGAVEACNASDHNLMLLMDPSGEPPVAQRLYRRVIQGRHLDGMVIAGGVVEDPIIGQLQADGFPFVLVGRHPQREVSFVDVDNRAAAQQAVAHLIAHGYRRIGTITGVPNMIAAIDRQAGYVCALQEAGMPLVPDLTVGGEFTRRGGYRAMQALLARPDGAPDAVFVASDTMASAALQALRDANLRAPEDVAVLGFDGLDASTVSQPVLSTMAQPIGDLGREAVRMLLELVERPDVGPMQRFLPTELLRRRSCGCESAADIPSPEEPSPPDPPPRGYPALCAGRGGTHAELGVESNGGAGGS